MSFEKTDNTTGEVFTWCDDMSLKELLKNENKIRANHKKRIEAEQANPNKSGKLSDTFSPYTFDNRGCLICTS